MTPTNAQTETFEEETIPIYQLYQQNPTGGQYRGEAEDFSGGDRVQECTLTRDWLTGEEGCFLAAGIVGRPDICPEIAHTDVHRVEPQL